jgi:threonine aldolase
MNATFAAISAANAGSACAYGDDAETARLAGLVAAHFGDGAVAVHSGDGAAWPAHAAPLAPASSV